MQSSNNDTTQDHNEFKQEFGDAAVSSAKQADSIYDWKYYTGTKFLYATPMDRLQYNNYRGWQVPSNEDPTDEGYLVEYTDGGKPNDPRHKGYISWSPKDVFEGTYKQTPDNSDISDGMRADGT